MLITTKKFRVPHWMMTPTMRQKVSLVFALGLSALALLASPTHAAVNVYFSNSAPASLQDQFIADTTKQYQATVVKSQFLSNTYTITISSRYAVAECSGVVKMPCDLDADVNSIVAVATHSYVYGFANGLEDERWRDLGTIDNFRFNCSSAPYFNASTVTWSSSTCAVSLSTVSWNIFQQFFSTPTIH